MHSSELLCPREKKQVFTAKCKKVINTQEKPTNGLAKNNSEVTKIIVFFQRSGVLRKIRRLKKFYKKKGVFQTKKKAFSLSLIAKFSVPENEHSQMQQLWYFIEDLGSNGFQVIHM